MRKKTEAPDMHWNPIMLKEIPVVMLGEIKNHFKIFVDIRQAAD